MTEERISASQALTAMTILLRITHHSSECFPGMDCDDCGNIQSDADSIVLPRHGWR
ncbi:MAG: hypothetical protein ACOX8B_07995 [Lachnospiraceae bacterium]|jgi:hypothetical protein